ncbi:hypothetical protein BJY01DRAFT_212890 [Aspergillus pseudoustus]|uniref:DUF7580 domain-containing protein n=1 Tax=Aspergillus pseudoustus TaxID=1810923 RepID=A0ABR4K6N1_9EURO
MVTGVECAGLVLAVLPLFISTAEAYSKGAETLWGVILRSRADDALQDFYCEFHWQIGLLHEQLKSISNALADQGHISNNDDNIASQLKTWKNNAGIKKSLIVLLGSEASFRRFETATMSIVKLLGQLLRERKTISRPSQKGSITDNEQTMYDRLQEFAVNKELGKTKNSFAERFRFFRDKTHRDISLKNLGIWNKRLGKLISEAESRNKLTNPRTVSPPSDILQTSPFLRSLIGSPAIVREVTRDLYAALAGCWVCSCPGGHEARVCLNMEDALEHAGADIPITFDMLVNVADGKNLVMWKEGTVLIKLASSTRQDDDFRLQNICESLGICLASFRLRILMEHMSGQHSLWKLDTKPRRLCFSPEDPVPLKDLLDNFYIMTRAQKCELGLIVTYALLLFHDSPWNAIPWDKNKLSFFYRAVDEPDYLRPFITTRFEKGNTEVGTRGENVFHRNYNIFRLGILLIEIFTQSRIERFRTAQERREVRPGTEANTDLRVAYRVVEKLDDVPYRAAIKSCLELDWFPEGQRVLLEDLTVRKGIYENVIEPLKREQGFAS